MTGKWEEMKGVSSVQLFSYLKQTSSTHIAAFDLDDTIIRTKSGKSFSENASDWVFLDQKDEKKSVIASKLRKLHENGYRIVVFSNQYGITKGVVKIETLQKKVEMIANAIGIPMLCFFAIAKDRFRKPMIGCWQMLEENYNKGCDIEYEESFYVGDAAGRKKDHSSVDLDFAWNIGLYGKTKGDFQFFTPETFFYNAKPQKQLYVSRATSVAQEYKQQLHDENQNQNEGDDESENNGNENDENEGDDENENDENENDENENEGDDENENEDENEDDDENEGDDESENDENEDDENDNKNKKKNKRNNNKKKNSDNNKKNDDNDKKINENKDKDPKNTSKKNMKFEHPSVIICIGPPGSGKTTMATSLAKEQDFVHVSRDALGGSVKKCEDELRRALLKGKSVIIDCTNPKSTDRAKWISIAKESHLPVYGLHFTPSKKLAMASDKYRVFTQNTKPLPAVAFHTYYSKFEQPSVENEEMEEIFRIPFFIRNDFASKQRVDLSSR